MAKYFEPAGAVSWDVAMTATKPDWRVALHPGDRLDLSTTYDTRRASWYESMGIDVLYYADGIQPGAVDPFAGKVDWHGELTHGHLPENEHHGGARTSLPDARTIFSGPVMRRVSIAGFVYGQGDLSATGAARRPPVVHAGDALTFKNLDATYRMPSSQAAYHTITSCRAPCTASTGIAYPLANGGVQFDSGELGYGGAPSRRPQHVVDAQDAQARHLHVLLPHPPVHARVLPRRPAVTAPRSARAPRRRHRARHVRRTDAAGRRRVERGHRDPARGGRGGIRAAQDAVDAARLAGTKGVSW